MYDRDEEMKYSGVHRVRKQGGQEEKKPEPKKRFTCRNKEIDVNFQAKMADDYLKSLQVQKDSEKSLFNLEF